MNKRIVANETSKIESPCVVKLASKDDEDEWHERVLDFINRLKNSGKIQDYNQLAFLFSSVKHERVISLARFLESNHINVYSPRSDMFFRREEVMQTLGCMMLMFPNYIKGLENGEYKFLDNTHYFYFRDCIKAANEFVTKPRTLNLRDSSEHTGKDMLRWRKFIQGQQITHILDCFIGYLCISHSVTFWILILALV